MSEPLLAAQDVVAGYGKQDAVRGLSLRVQPGELWAVLGPNGAGKSTFLKACLGLLPLRAGAVQVLGRAVESWPRQKLAQSVAWVPQDVSVDEGFTALDLVLMGRTPHHAGLALPNEQDVMLAHAALRELGVESLAGRPAGALSGGERRLVLLARAFAQMPQLLVLDEPTAFLDLRHQVEVLGRVRTRVRERGLGAVAVLHDVNLAAAFADKVLLLAEGRALGQGSASEWLREAHLEKLYALPMAGAELEGGQRIFAARGAP